jgi:aspartate/methionine/tyrosine aminotransferase
LANVAVGGSPNDRAAVVWPNYQSLHDAARSAGAKVDLLKLTHEDGWAFDPVAL